jgi:hypothetical protein
MNLSNTDLTQPSEYPVRMIEVLYEEAGSVDAEESADRLSRKFLKGNAPERKPERARLPGTGPVTAESEPRGECFPITR